jgi:predicted nucleic acid-binding Zn ribbon protein
LANVPHSYCPFRAPHTPGALSFCNDECSLYIRNTKLPPQKSCAFSLMGVHALQKIIVTQQKSGTAAPPAPPAPPETPPKQ